MRVLLQVILLPLRDGVIVTVGTVGGLPLFERPKYFGVAQQPWRKKARLRRAFFIALMNVTGTFEFFVWQRTILWCIQIVIVFYEHEVIALRRLL
jgi:hypothetical protein